VKTFKANVNESVEDARSFSRRELREVIRNLQLRRSPGSDNVYNRFLKRLSSKLRAELLRLINLIWKTGEMPSPFLKAIVVPILKPDKDPTDPASYRPIALTSSLSKLIERLVVNRLTYRLENNKILSYVQSAFRSNRSTTDTLMRLVAEIQQGFESMPALRTVLAQLDLTSAYNRVEHSAHTEKTTYNARTFPTD